MQSQATVNPVMTGHAVQFMRSPMGFVGLALFPAFSSGQQSSDYYVWKRENSLNIPRNIRHAPGAKFSRSLPMIADDQYACRDYGHETPVPDEIRAKYRNHLNADLASIRRNVEIIKVNHELRVKSLVDGSGVPNAGISVKWDAASGSDPKGDVDVAKEAVRKNSGQRANLMVISESVRLVLSNHAQIAERIKYTVPGITTLQLMAGFFEVDRIVVADQVENTAKEGQTVTPNDIWGDNVYLAHVESAQDLMRPNFGRTFFWTDFGSVGGEDVPIMVESYRDETCASDVHRSRHFTDEKLVYPEAGYRINDVLT